MPQSAIVKVALVLGLAAIAGMCFANDGYSIETGSALNFSKSKNIQMVSEAINIRLDDDKARVQVDFVFRNHGGMQTVTMAFPDEGYNTNLPSITGFKSWVDGKPTKVVFRNLTGNEEDQEVKGVWTKRVSFDAGQTRNVRVLYTAPHGGSTMKDADCEYILTTGATWYGKIQETKLTVDWSGLKEVQPPVFWEIRKRKDTYLSKPVGSNWAISGKRATATYRDFVPDFDVRMHMLPGFWNFFINGKPAGISNGPSFPIGDPKDIRIPVAILGDLFKIWTPDGEYHDEWTQSCVRFFGGPITFPDNETMLLGGRRRVNLKRPIVTKWGVNVWQKGEAVPMVFLKDVVEGAGGSYRFNAGTGRVEIKIPK